MFPRRCVSALCSRRCFSDQSSRSPPFALRFELESQRFLWRFVSTPLSLESPSLDRRLGWAIASGMNVLPRSRSPGHMAANIGAVRLAARLPRVSTRCVCVTGEICISTVQVGFRSMLVFQQPVSAVQTAAGAYTLRLRLAQFSTNQLANQLANRRCVCNHVVFAATGEIAQCKFVSAVCQHTNPCVPPCVPAAASVRSHATTGWLGAALTLLHLKFAGAFLWGSADRSDDSRDDSLCPAVGAR